MKQIFVLLSVAVLLVSACKKDKENIQNPDGTIDIQKITLQTLEPSFRTDHSVRTGGKTSIDLSKHTYLEFGVCFGEDPTPTINDEVVFSTVSSNGEYESIIDKKYVKEGVTLYVRAYIKDLNKNTIRYGNELKAEKEYIPVDGEPVDVTKIYLTTNAPVVGESNIVTVGAKASLDLNKYEELVYGICYSTNPEPTTSNNVIEAERSNNGDFSVIINNLGISTSQTIYFRAFILNLEEETVKYGNVVSVALSPVTYDARLLNGTFVGRHYWDATSSVLDILQGIIPPDPETGEVLDIKKGFADTLTFSVRNNQVYIYSSMLKIELEGIITGSNKFGIPQKTYTEIVFSPMVFQDAFIMTASDVQVPSDAIGTKISLNLKVGGKIAAVPFPLDMPTKGDFVKIK